MKRLHLQNISRLLVCLMLFCLLSNNLPVTQAMASAQTLTGLNKTIYELVKPEVQKMAAGQRESTMVTVKLSDLGIEKKYYLSDLGVESPYVYQDGAYYTNPELISAVEVKMSEVFGDYNGNLVLQALWRSLPYDFYWSTDRGSFNIPQSSWTIRNEYKDGGYVYYVWLTSDIVFWFPVSPSYKASSDYTIDTSKLTAGLAIPARARAIVEQAKNMSDYEKLKYYAEKIVEMVDYDYYSAFNMSEIDYYDPWQVVWALDDDESTKVVCEGYAKAYKYLCDLTTFKDSSVICHCVSGIYDAPGTYGAHMWNIVHMDDGKNYLVDITNCDFGTELDPTLFMAIPVSGSVSDGYVFTKNNASHSYTYDSDAKMLYQTSELALSQTAYMVKNPTPTVTNTPMPTATNTPSPTATNTPVPTATNTPAPTFTSTPVPIATNTPSPTATSTPIPTATIIPKPTATNTPPPTSTCSPVPTATNSPIPTATNTPVPTTTNTPTPNATSTPLPTNTNTPIPTATNTPAATATSTPTPTATSTPGPTVTNTPTATPTPTMTSTPVPTITNTPEATMTSTPEPTATNTPEATMSVTPEPTVTSTPVPIVISTLTPTVTNTPSPTATSMPEPTATSEPEPTITVSPVPTPEASISPEPVATSKPKENTANVVLIVLVIAVVALFSTCTLLFIIILKRRRKKT